MAELLFVQMQTRAASWRLSEGKQVLAAKCAFSEQRNDCYVLAAVITGTLPRARLPLQQHVLLLWMERLLHREGFDSLHVQQTTGIKHSGAAVSSFPMAHSLPADSERCSDASFFEGLSWYLTQLFNMTLSEIWCTETSPRVLVTLCVGRRKNVTGLRYGRLVLLYIVNNCNN